MSRQTTKWEERATMNEIEYIVFMSMSLLLSRFQSLLCPELQRITPKHIYPCDYLENLMQSEKAYTFYFIQWFIFHLPYKGCMNHFDG